MQVSVVEQDAVVPRRPLSPRSPWTATWSALAVAVPVSVGVLASLARPVSLGVLAGVLLAMVAAESVNLQFEFRRQPLF